MKETDTEKLRLACETVEAESRASYYSCIGQEGAKALGVQVLLTGSATLTLASQGPSPFFNRVVALGITSESGQEELDRIEGLLSKAGAKGAMLGISPYAKPAGLEQLLKARGYSEGPVWAKLARGPNEPQKAATDLQIVEIDERHKHALAFSRILIPSFGMDPVYAPLVQAVVGKPEWHCYLAMDGESPVATAGMYVSPRGAWLGFMATLPDTRRRGAQSALIERRLRDGIACGCPVFVTETALDMPDAPNPSYHNMKRMGFEHLYDRQHFIWTNTNLT